jgi:hypothetical protein
MKFLVRKAKAFITAILDVHTQFAAAGSLIQAVGTAILDGIIPLDTTGMNLGNGMTPVYLVIGITTEVDSAGDAATIDFKLYSHSTATVTSGVLHVSSGVVAQAAMTAGDIVLAVALPQGEYGAFLGVAFTVAGADVTAGACNAYLTMDPPEGWKAYPNAISD